MVAEYLNRTEFKPIIDASLVLHLTADDGTTSSWLDNTGNSNNCTLYNALNGVTRKPLTTDPYFGSSVVLDGISGYGTVNGASSSLQLPSTFTIQTMIKYPGTAPTTNNQILSKNYWYGIWSMIFNSDYSGSVNCRSESPASVVRYTVATINLGLWNDVTYTVDLDRIEMYLNGTFVAEQVITVPSLSVNNLPLYLGRYAGGYYANMEYGSVLIYNRVLLSTEINYNYKHTPMYYLQQGIDPGTVGECTPLSCNLSII